MTNVINTAKAVAKSSESFEKLHSFSDEDKKDKKSEYHKMRKSLIEKI